MSETKEEVPAQEPVAVEENQEETEQKEVAEEICKKLLTNIVIEDYTISLE